MLKQQEINELSKKKVELEAQSKQTLTQAKPTSSPARRVKGCGSKNSRDKRLRKLNQRLPPQEESKAAAQKIQEIAKTVPDPRQTGKVLFPLESILALTLLACFVGETSAVSIVVYWRQHLAELSELFEDFPKDVPLIDCFDLSIAQNSRKF